MIDPAISLESHSIDQSGPVNFVVLQARIQIFYGR